VQMGIVAILAVFAGDAGNGGGPAFAITYAAFLVVMTWLWYTVRRQDVIQRLDRRAGADGKVTHRPEPRHDPNRLGRRTGRDLHDHRSGRGRLRRRQWTLA